MIQFPSLEVVDPSRRRGICYKPSSSEAFSREMKGTVGLAGRVFSCKRANHANHRLTNAEEGCFCHDTIFVCCVLQDMAIPSVKEILIATKF